MTMQLVRAGQARRVRWRNDGGWTREIASGTVARPVAETTGADWDWRISVAEIEQDGPFSLFPGIDRCLILLEGSGMDLDFGGGDGVRIVPARPRIEFAGEAGIQCRLLDGPTCDFNAMWRRSVLSAQVEPLSLDGSMTTELGAGWTAAVFHVLAGRADLSGQALGMADTLVVVPPHPEPVRLTGSARLLTAVFRSLPSA